MTYISGEQMPPFEGYRGTKTLLGNREHKKMFISIFENVGTSQFLIRGTRDKHTLNLGNMRLKFYCLLEALSL